MSRSSNMHQMNSPSSSFADKSILSHPPMELTDEEKKQFAAMWDNVPPENVVYLSQEEYDKFVDKLNNPPEPNERLVKFLTQPSMLEKLAADEQAVKGMQQLWKHSENYLEQLKLEISKNMGIPKHLGGIDPRKATVV